MGHACLHAWRGLLWELGKGQPGQAAPAGWPGSPSSRSNCCLDFWLGLCCWAGRGCGGLQSPALLVLCRSLFSASACLSCLVVAVPTQHVL